MNGAKTYDQLVAENERLHWQLEEATETIQAIRTGQVDALVVQRAEGGHELYTLKTADHTYRIFIETMNEGAVTLNKDGLILYCNSAFAALVELPLSQVIGLSFAQFTDPHCQDVYDSLFKEGWAENRKLELTIRNDTNKQVPCQLSVNTLELDGGICLSMILTDLTAQKQYQYLLKVNNQQLAEANAALETSNQLLTRSNQNLEQFAYIASHDLQEPLRKIQQFGDLLKSRYTDPSDQELSYLERMQSAASRMSLLIKDLLAFSRISTRQVALVPVDLNWVVEEALENLSVALEETKAQVDINKLPTLQGDVSQLVQLFQNLFSNALKFSRTHESGGRMVPRITVSTSEVSATDLPASVTPTRSASVYHRISVSDNGIGFDEKYIDRIFQVFQRLHGKNEFAGTGVGLAICQKVAINHGGAITATSEPGQGATFSVYFPVQP